MVQILVQIFQPMTTHIPTATLFFDKRKQKKNKKYPVKLTVYYAGEKKRYNIPFEFTEEEWKKITSPKLKDERLKDDKIKVHYYAEGKFDEAIKKLSVFSFDAFEDSYFEKPVKIAEYDVYAAMDRYIEKLGRSNRIGSSVTYTNAKKSLQNFKKYLTFREVTPDFLESYEKEMINNGYSITTVGIYLRSLRTIINQAIEQGLMKPETYPFKKNRYEIPSGRNIKKALTFEEIKAIINYEPKSESEKRSKDFWLFSYYCNGINMADICQLKYKNIIGDQIVFLRAKTKRSTKSDPKPIKAFLNDEMNNIINTYGNNDKSPENYIFPILTNDLEVKRKYDLISFFVRNINKYLKVISEELKLSTTISTYSARHSFATVLKRKGVSIAAISESLGHSDMKTTENYLDSFTDDTIKENSRLLTEL